MSNKIYSKSLLSSMMIAMLSVIFLACSTENEIIPQISIPSGNENVFTKAMNFDSPAAERPFTFSSNVDWIINVAENQSGTNWLSVYPTSGKAGTHTVMVKASENTTYDDRNAVIMLTAGDSLRTVFVNQKQLDALTLTANRFEVPVEGGSVNVEVKSNIDYDVIIPNHVKEWIHQTNGQTRALSASTLTFSIDRSEEYSKREGQIIIKAKDKEEIVTIYQAGEGILTLTQNVYNLSSSAQELSIV